jgi:hypothetical protein
MPMPRPQLPLSKCNADRPSPQQAHPDPAASGAPIATAAPCLEVAANSSGLLTIRSTISTNGLRTFSLVLELTRRQLLALRIPDRPRRRPVQLAAHQVHDRPGDGVRLGLLEPPLHGLEAAAVRDVVDQDHAVRPAVVAVRQRAEPLLPRGVEEIELVRLAADGELLALRGISIAGVRG